MCAASVLAGLLAASCVGPSPQQVDSSNPTVTYKFQRDGELDEVNQRAAEFCDRYHRAPRVARYGNDSDGSRTVVFECVRGSPMADSHGPYDRSLTSTYRTTEELAEATRNAQAYCDSIGRRQTTSRTVSNGDGTSTVTFQCGSR